jgi:hypothetical protein
MVVDEDNYSLARIGRRLSIPIRQSPSRCRGSPNMALEDLGEVYAASSISEAQFVRNILSDEGIEPTVAGESGAWGSAKVPGCQAEDLSRN